MSTKRCYVCGETKSISLFSTTSRKKAGKDGYRGECKSCFAKYKRELRNRKRVEALIKMGGECVDCGLKYDGTNSHKFDFHHTDPSKKEGNISRELADATEETRLKELDKCVLLCKPCHNKRHSDFKKGLRDTL